MPQKSPRDSLGGLGVLVVENDKYMRFSVHQQLDRLDATVFEAGSNDEAWDRLNRFPINLVIYDVETSPDGGEEFFARVRRAGRNVPVLLLSRPISNVDLTSAVHRLAGGLHYLQ